MTREALARARERARPRSRVALFAAAALLAGGVQAQEVAPLSTPETGALEIGLGAGVTGMKGRVGRDVPAVADAGLGLDLSVAHGVSARWALGVYGAGATYQSPGASGREYDAAVGLQAIHRFGSAPAPWVSVGLGWHRFADTVDGNRRTYDGVDVLRVQAGSEALRLLPGVRLSPVIGATVSTFLRNDGGDVVNGRGPVVFFFMGTRFDLVRGATL